MTKKIRNFPDELKNSIDVDEKLNGFKWENNRHKWYMKTLEEYEQNPERDR